MKNWWGYWFLCDLCVFAVKSWFCLFCHPVGVAACWLHPSQPPLGKGRSLYSPPYEGGVRGGLKFPQPSL